MDDGGAGSSLAWSGELPAPSRLQAEACAMAFAVRDSLLDRCAGEITLEESAAIGARVVG